MKKSDFQFDLPKSQIAQRPLPMRSDSRLMCLGQRTGMIQHRQFLELPKMLRPTDLLVFNNTRVIPARLFARKETGGEIEIMIERLLSGTRCRAQLRVSKKPAPGSNIVLAGGQHCLVLDRDGEFFELQLENSNWNTVMAEQGRMPLPPYIDRDATESDDDRYQTVYASRPGAVAAPTAGLHFDQRMLDRLDHDGIASAYVTLHVGAGTFQPVRAEMVADHEMHHEYLDVPQETVQAVRDAHTRGGRVVAVGTTTVRALESAAATGKLHSFDGESNLFIYPGYEFKVVDAIVTNFHLPESTLLMMVCAFAGTESVLRAYRQAVAMDYRFFSYGDAMYIG